MRVLICGGGIAGLTLASCLERQGITSLIVERAPRLRDQGYMVDFFGSGYDVAARLGLLSELEQIHAPVSSVRFLDRRGRVRTSISYPRLRRRLFDDRHFNFLRGDLERLLYERIAGRVEVRFGVSVEAIAQRGSLVLARLSDGVEHECDVLVGADGVHSRVRQLAFGPESGCTRFLGCMAAGFVAPMPPALGTLDAFDTLSLVRRQVAVYPLCSGQVATFFLYRAVGQTLDCSRAAAQRQLQSVYGDLDWIVPALLAGVSTARDFFFDAVSQIVQSSWSHGRVVLIGDAGYCVSLLAGQGAGLAMTGAYVLAEELARGPEVPDALERYEARLRPGIEQLQASGRRIARWLLPASAFHLALRDVMMRASAWPLVSDVLRRRVGTHSVLNAPRSATAAP